MRRRNFLAAAAAGVGGACGPAPERVDGLEPLMVMAYMAPSVAGLYFARSRGYFREAGLDVDIEVLSAVGTLQALPALATGRVDVAFFKMSPAFVSAVARGVKARAVMVREVMSADCPLYGTLVGRREVFPDGLEDLSVLRGKLVALPAEATMAQFFMEDVLASGGLTPDDVTRGPLGREALPALRAGKIDAMFASDMRIRVSEMKEKFVVSRAASDVLRGFPAQFVYFSETLLAADDDRGARFLAAFLRGLDVFRQGELPEEILRYFDLRKVQTDRTVGLCRNSFAEGGRIDLNGVGRFADWCYEKGYCKRRVRAEELVDLRFLEPAARLLEG